MATSKNTSTIEAANTRAPKFTPATNPLSCDHPEDTMRAVSELLGFMQHAILSNQEQGAIDFDMEPGLLSIINVCQSALKSHLPAKGGAA